MTHLRHLMAFLLAGLQLLAPLGAQTPAELASLDPSHLYFQGWILARDSDTLIEKDQYLDAYIKLKKAKTMFDTVAINHPTFKPDLVKGRQESTRETMDAIYIKASTQQEESKKKNGFIEGEDPGENLIIPLDPKADAKRMGDLNSMQRKIEQLQRQLNESNNGRNANAAKLREALKNLQEERNDIASAPLRSELEALNKEISGLRREKDALSLALGKTKATLLKTRQELDFTQKALAELQRRGREQQAVIEEQRKINGSVVKGQQDQIDKLRREMKMKDKLLAEEREKTKQLGTQLTQSLAMIDDLQLEYNDLIKEKEQLNALLKMTVPDQVQKLLSQNVSLSKEFTDAKRQVKASMENSNASKEGILLAQRGLTLARAKIRDTQRENAQQKMRVHDLERRLKMAQEDIISQSVNGNLDETKRQELAWLREVVKKQRDDFEAAQKKGELLVAQARRMGIEDPLWKQAIAQFDDSFKPSITPEEDAMIDRVRADFTVTSKFEVTAYERRVAAEELGRREDDLNKVATRLYSKDDLEASRGILEMIIEENPAAWDAMVNLGIVKLRLEQPSEAAKHFEQAILYAGNRKIPVAHFMLGDAYYRSQIFPEAEREINISLELDPENANAHVILGNMAGKMGRGPEAKIHFEQAISIDPNIWEPHFNLAYMAARSGKNDQAKILYQEALRRGAPARPDFEQQIGL
ncbi:MAG: tetratricopeptide repeat protein [Akkermansiaceae bacterium]|jgi:tetratricopeptide (TPR) repeat protein